MGIVVTIAMLLGLVLAVPLALARQGWLIRQPGLRLGIATLVLLAGLWNAAWYGVQHINQFWGLAATGSGLVMIAVAISAVATAKQQRLNQFLCLALLGFFLLYAITLIRLNLNMPILR